MKLIINDDVYQQIMFYVRLSPIECSGLGKVVIEGENLRVVSICLLKQENTGSTTDIEPQAVSKALFELRNSPGSLNFWWHSHVNMSAFWSGTDKDTIREIGANGFCIATVFNKKSEWRTAYYQGAIEGRPAIFLDELETHVDRVLNPDLTAEWKADFEAKCEVKKYEPYQGGYSAWNNGDESDYLARWAHIRAQQDEFPLIDYRSTPAQGEIYDLAQLEMSVRKETMDKLDNYSDSMVSELTHDGVKKWLGRICKICHQIERHLVQPMKVDHKIKQEFKQYYVDLSNAQLKSLGENHGTNDIAANIN